jgi:glycine/D-amino acid oxidase-like deaminating enzyme
MRAEVFPHGQSGHAWAAVAEGREAPDLKIRSLVYIHRKSWLALEEDILELGRETSIIEVERE